MTAGSDAVTRHTPPRSRTRPQRRASTPTTAGTSADHTTRQRRRLSRPSSRPSPTWPGASPTTQSQACSHDDDLVEVHGARPSEPLLVRRGWLRDHLPKAPPLPRRGRKRARPLFVPCDPLTGARLDPGDHLATDAYRPSDQLAALVRARDGRCRFPGCSIAARFCDLDHVRPWPTGRTAARNLLTLCRRHHRIKQRPGWRLRLAPDGTATWTDPTGRQRTTTPLNALQSLVLRADSADDRTRSPPRHHRRLARPPEARPVQRGIRRGARRSGAGDRRHRGRTAGDAGVERARDLPRASPRAPPPPAPRARPVDPPHPSALHLSGQPAGRVQPPPHPRPVPDLPPF